MKNKKLFIGVALATTLVVPFSVFASTSASPVAKNIRHFLRIDSTKLNDSQKADVKSYEEKMATVQKDFINQMVSNGSITQEQGNAEISRIDEDLKNGAINALPGMVQGMRKGEGKDSRGFGMFDLSKLTDTQKADLKASHLAMLNLQKEYLPKMVADGLLTQAQADANSKKIDEIIANADKEDLAKGPGLFIRGIEGVGPRLDNSKLTDAQKTDLTEFNTKMEALKKALMDKMIANGAITQTQADKMNQKPGFNKGKFQKGHFGKQNGQRRLPNQQPEVQQ